VTSCLSSMRSEPTELRTPFATNIQILRNWNWVQVSFDTKITNAISGTLFGVFLLSLQHVITSG